jgi:hypothetical protein
MERREFDGAPRASVVELQVTAIGGSIQAPCRSYRHQSYVEYVKRPVRSRSIRSMEPRSDMTVGQCYLDILKFVFHGNRAGRLPIGAVVGQDSVRLAAKTRALRATASSGQVGVLFDAIEE